MDNLTHSLAGLAIGEVIDRSLPVESDEGLARLRRRLILVSSTAANNFPDIDFIFNPLLAKPLGYLLMHRGHTHTFLFLIPQTLLLLAVFWFLFPPMRNLLRQSHFSRVGLLLSLLIGLVAHIGFDYLNSYGVHPFYPFNGLWYYGDLVFIIEPFLWLFLGVPFFAQLQRIWLKALGILVLLGIPFYFTYAGFLPWISFLMLLTVALILFAFAFYSPRRSLRSSLSAIMLSLLFIVIQFPLSQRAREKVEASIKLRNEKREIFDVAMSPFPANPFCWSFHAISAQKSVDSYQLVSGVVSLNPDWVKVKDCSMKLIGGREFVEGDDHIGWLKEEAAGLSALKNSAASNCHLYAWLRFSRMPYVNSKHAIDTRFSRGGVRVNFTYFSYPDFDGKECSSVIPEYDLPRQDLLNF